MAVSPAGATHTRYLPADHVASGEVIPSRRACSARWEANVPHESDVSPHDRQSVVHVPRGRKPTHRKPTIDHQRAPRQCYFLIIPHQGITDLFYEILRSCQCRGNDDHFLFGYLKIGVASIELPVRILDQVRILDEIRQTFHFQKLSMQMMKNTRALHGSTGQTSITRVPARDRNSSNRVCCEHLSLALTAPRSSKGPFLEK